MKLVVFGLSITSSWGNGHATTYRGLLRELARLGYAITFVERDVEWYASNRDLWEAEYAAIMLYNDWAELTPQLDDLLHDADVVLAGSYFSDGICLVDRLSALAPNAVKVYYDIDTPITLTNFCAGGTTEYLRADQIPSFDLVLSFTGGRALDELRDRYGAKQTAPFYCAIDPEIHCPHPPASEYLCRLGYMGTYAADRQPSVEAFLIEPANRLPEYQFILAGPQYPNMCLPPNLLHYIHLSPQEHARFYSSNGMTLNLTRAAMRAYGYAPSVRLFEAAGCGTCIVSDSWTGIETFLEPGKEILLAETTEDVCRYITQVSLEEKQAIGAAARKRILQEHTYAARAGQFDKFIRRLRDGKAAIEAE